MQSPAASITLGNAGMVGPSSCQKYAPVGSRRVVADAGRARRELATEIAIPCSAADCKLRHVVGRVLNTALCGIRSNDIASCHNYAHCRRKTREKLSTALCGTVGNRRSYSRDVTRPQCRSYDESYTCTCQDSDAFLKTPK